MTSQRATENQIDWEASSALTDQDLTLLANVPRSLAQAVALKRWWEQTDANNGYADRFELVRTFHDPSVGYGFFDKVSLPDGPLPIMGVVQEMLFDQPKQAPSEKVLAEFREFVLRYFMRVSDYRQPAAFAEGPQHDLPVFLRAFSWCPSDSVSLGGFGYSQLYYKLRESEQVGKFPESVRSTIVDLREIGAKYEWIVCKTSVFNFYLTFQLFRLTYQPLGLQSPEAPLSPWLAIPYKADLYVVLSGDFITNQDNPAPDVAGRYGFGYAILNYQDRKSIFAYGPGHFQAGFELIQFDAFKNGQTRAHMAFAVNRPDKILNIDMNPIGLSITLADLFSLGLTSQLLAPLQNVLDRLSPRTTGFDPVTSSLTLVNLLTGGQAAEQLCISKSQLEKQMLIEHFMEHYQMIVGGLLTWRQVPDWLDTAALPQWVVKGISP